MSEFNWLAAQKSQPTPSTEGGASGYLSAPQQTLDPHLFQGEKLRVNAEKAIEAPLERFLGNLHLAGYNNWLRLWITGSGVSYQWAADRGNGDLDVMVGIDHIMFRDDNPAFAGFSDADLAGWLNQHLKQELWPKTANTNINGKVFEITYYYNAGTQMDINAIHPYAAYSLDADRFVVEPPKLPQHPANLYPRDWFQKAEEDKWKAEDFVRRYHRSFSILNGSQNEVHQHNAGAQLNMVTAQAGALLDDIHHGRQGAFQEGGQGYGDWRNFRWQRAKATGTIKALSELHGIRDRALQDKDQELYGGPIAAADELVRRAMLAHKDFNG